MLFVDYDSTDIFQRGEYRRAGAYGYLCLARAQPPPLVEAFARREPAVQYCRAFAEAAAKLREHLRGERNFRHEEDGSLAAFKRPLYYV